MRSPQDTADGKDELRVLLIIAHVGFVLAGVVTTLLGALLPALSAKWSLDDAAAGRLFAAQFTGSLVGTILSSRLIARLDLNRSLAIGFVLMLVGIAGLGIGERDAGLFAILVYGVGLGLTMPAINLLVAEANPHARAAALNLLSFAWGVGAVISAPVFGVLVNRLGTAQPLLGLSFLLGIIALLLFKSRRIKADDEARTRIENNAALKETNVWRSPFVPLIGLLLFFYVGAENSVGGWIASYASRLEDATPSARLFAPSLFWATLLAGRLIAPLLLRFISAERLVLVGLLMAIVGIAQLLFQLTQTGLFIGVALTGFGFASVFPNTIAALSQSFGVAASRVLGFMFALAALGGATLPYLVGYVSTRFGNLRYGLSIAMLCGFFMMILQVALMLLISKNRVTANQVSRT